MKKSFYLISAFVITFTLVLSLSSCEAVIESVINDVANTVTVVNTSDTLDANGKISTLVRLYDDSLLSVTVTATEGVTVYTMPKKNYEYYESLADWSSIPSYKYYYSTSSSKKTESFSGSEALSAGEYYVVVCSAAPTEQFVNRKITYIKK